MIPEKWRVLRTNDNYKVLNAWENAKISRNGAYLSESAWFYSDRPYDSIIYSGYREITFEEFKKYVLKEEIIFDIFN